MCLEDINLYLLNPVPPFWEQRKKVGDFDLRLFIPISVTQCITCIFSQIVRGDSHQGKNKQKQLRGSLWDGTIFRYPNFHFTKGEECHLLKILKRFIEVYLIGG